MNNDLSKLEAILGYSFTNKQLLVQALTHKSYANERKINKTQSYERIEFLGDAVLELIISDYLYNHYKDKPEGELTKLRASIVCEYTLAMCAKDISLGDFLFLSKGEELTGGRNRDSILCDVFESLLGAIYLDSGISQAKSHVEKFLLRDIEDKTLFYDAKTILQEMVQGMNSGELQYELIGESGPDHCKEFIVQTKIGDSILCKGVGRNKKSAEQMAAYQSIIQLKNKSK